MDNRHVLVLGAGLVTKPLVRYLLETAGYTLTVGDMYLEHAEEMLDGHPRGTAVRITTDETGKLTKMIKGADLVVSLLPYIYHAKIAELCLSARKSLVTTSYVSPEMDAMDAAAKDAGLIFLNECGVDPGLDHMSAKKVIDETVARNGRIVGFESCCSGLPAPESNTNPWGYKFSWSPRGAILAAKNPAQYLVNGRRRDVPGPDLFLDVRFIEVEQLGRFEVYPNRNSLQYRELYELGDIRTLFRGTIRHLGHCATWKALVDAGWLNMDRIDVKKKTYRQVFCGLLGCSNGTGLEEEIFSTLGLESHSEPVKRLKWLGLMGEDIVPGEELPPLDILAERMNEKMHYQKGETDMVILRHSFEAEFDDGKNEKIYSTLVDFGKIGGDTSMSRTVSLPAAISARLILEGKITRKGVAIPVYKEFYEPVLNELGTMGILFSENRTSSRA